MLHVCDKNYEGKTDDMVLNLIPLQISDKLTGCVAFSARVHEEEWIGKIFSLLLPKRCQYKPRNCHCTWKLFFFKSVNIFLVFITEFKSCLLINL